MSFFYDLNKKLADLARKQDAKQISEDAKAVEPKSKLAESMAVAEAGYSAKAGRAGKDLGEPGKNFSKIAKSAGQAYGSKAAGERVAGAVLNKLRGKTEEAATPMTPKQKSFAKLAPPTDKITFADKIAGAKEEVDEMLGDVAAEAMRKAITSRGGEVTKTSKGIKHRSTNAYGGTKDEPHALDRLKGPKIADEGNAFTGKLKTTPKGGKFKLGDKEFKDTSSIEEDDLGEGYAEMDAWLKSREKEKGTGRYDKRKVSTGTVYTRKPETFDDPETDAEATGGAPKRRGRPKGKDKGPERVTAKAWKHKGERVAKEGDEHVCKMCGQPTVKEGEHLGRPAKYGVCVVGHNDGKPVKTFDNEADAKAYADKGIRIGGKLLQGSVRTMVDEKAVSKAQQKFMGMVHATQKGEKAPSKEVAKVAKEMPKKAAKDFAATKHKGLPNKVKEESTDKEDNKAEKAGKKVAKDIEHDEGHKGRDDNRAEKAGKKATKDIEYDDKKDKEEKVDETTTAGSVATSSGAPKSSKGMQFGKGVYEGYNKQFNQILSEGMTVDVTMAVTDDGQPHKSISVTADGAEADQLAELLKMAGLHGQPEIACDACGVSPCGCDESLEENKPDWPTDQEQSDNALQYAGGLNGPKSTGQTTTPVIASQLRRQVSMEESVELERSLFATWKNYKG